MDNYAEGSSDVVTDYDITDETFSNDTVRTDTCMSRAYELFKYIEDPTKYPFNAAPTAVDQVFCKEIIFQVDAISNVEAPYIKDNGGGGFLTANGARGFNRGYRLTG